MEFLCDDIESLNLLLINRLAAIKLRMAGVSPDPSLPAVFHLMKWGVNAGVPLPHWRAAQELVRLCGSSARGDALRYLVENVPGGEQGLHRKLLRLPPRGAAQLLIDILDMRLKADPCNPYPEDEWEG